MSRVRRYFTETVTLQPGESVVRSIRTAFVTCLAATGGFKVAIDDEGFSEFGQGLTLTLDTPSRQIWLENASGSVNTIQLAYGEGSIRDQRLNVSAPINVIDPFQAALADDRVFVRLIDSAPASDKFAVAELANPAGSGVRLSVTGLEIRCDAAGPFALVVGPDSAPLTGGEQPSFATHVQENGVLVQGAAVMRRESRATTGFDPAVYTSIGSVTIEPQAPLSRQFSFVLEPNTTLRSLFYANGVRLTVGAQWVEEPI